MRGTVRAMNEKEIRTKVLRDGIAAILRIEREMGVKFTETELDAILGTERWER